MSRGSSPSLRPGTTRQYECGSPEDPELRDNCCQGAISRVCWHTMKRTTVKLPDDLDARLRHEAARRGVTVSELTRQAIESHLVGGGKRRLGAAGRSGRSDVSHRIEEILRSELTGR